MIDIGFILGLLAISIVLSLSIRLIKFASRTLERSTYTGPRFIDDDDEIVEDEEKITIIEVPFYARRRDPNHPSRL